MHDWISEIVLSREHYTCSMKACMQQTASRKEGGELAGGFGSAGNESRECEQS